MDYKEKVIAILNSQELSKEQKEKLESIFPELKESEDEKIRKELISFVRSMLVCHDKPNAERDEKYESWITWLEKQGDQDNNEDSNILQRFSFYSYKDEPNILYLSSLYVNEEYRNKGIGTKMLEVADEVAKSLNCHAIRLKTKKDSDAERLYRTHGYNSLATEERDEIWLEKQGEQKPIKEHNACEFCEDRYGCVSPCPLKLIDEEKPADKIEQKPAEWSEEDEKMFVNIKSALQNANKDYSREIGWFHLLRLQKQWRPSEKQINALSDVLSLRDIKYDVLSELLECLKKRREEQL